MTWPSDHFLLYNKKMHKIISGLDLVYGTKDKLGIETKWHSTANVDGFTSLFEIKKGEIQLRAACLNSDEPSQINGRIPSETPFGVFINQDPDRYWSSFRFYSKGFPFYYDDLNLGINYSGNLGLKSSELYHTGFFDEVRLIGQKGVFRKSVDKKALKKVVDILEVRGNVNEANELRQIHSWDSFVKELSRIEEILPTQKVLEIEAGTLNGISFQTISQTLRRQANRKSYFVKDST